MLSSLDYLSAKEKSEVHMFIDKAVSRLKKEDRDLPQILMVRDLLSRGIGIHHGGLLPIMKEVIEILFSKSLVKVLFATETFAMGLNLPTRTVVFANTGKHDGRSFRQLLPGEYTQMAGRAGRRGLDPTGTVIIMCNDPEAPPMAGLRAMMLGTPTKLQSQFRLTYNMILNLLRIEALKVEDMIKRSFSENSSQVLLPEHEKNVKASEASLQNLKRDPCPICDIDIDQVHDEIVKYSDLSSEILNLVIQSPIGRRAIVSGRLIVFYDEFKKRRCLGILNRILARDRKFLVLLVAKMGNSRAESEALTKVPYLTMVSGFASRNLKQFTLLTRFHEVAIDISAVELIASMSVRVNFSDAVRSKREEIARITEQLETCLKFQSNWHPLTFSKLKDAQLTVLLTEREEALKIITASKSIKCKNFMKTYSQVHEEYMIKQKIASLKQLISDQNLELLPDYEQRIQVLKDLNYIDEDLNVLLKGRVACEISSGFELIVTELVLNNFLGEYEPEEIVALLSAFVFEGNTKIDVETVTPRLDQGRARILDIVTSTNKVFEAHQVLMTQDEAEFTERMRFGLMEVVYEWARGMSFNSITQLTDVQEGTIVRVITRMDEICREVMAAARIIGDSTLYDKMLLAQEKIKRDIVFCASLYI
ncbi:SKI complex RNA helicase subunit SKI2 [Sugiyamaella lignohabitans]|uniref:SKI complex RNA helicase subunit SKI2 n=1 Tax=Sugiyamaella lignohabitans TaxID=796027 RepID=A0A167DAB9_9ASCO|nr:SKI complex RNA helicase subunit SKI2 [Sugiyamaella lignohabitans]ANB12672.1 SKI complex RNA helicase subunit SKI2 [Sugiyamaella lignohabitans]